MITTAKIIELPIHEGCGKGKETRFHNLRHSAAPILLSYGFSLKEVGGWPPHADISTTSNIYAHLQYQAKQDMAKTLIRNINSKLVINSLPHDSRKNMKSRVNSMFRGHNKSPLTIDTQGLKALIRVTKKGMKGYRAKKSPSA